MEMDKGIKVKLIPISHRAKNRIHEHGEYMFLIFGGRSRDNKRLFQSERKTWNGEHWKGWFELGVDVKISEDGGSG